MPETDDAASRRLDIKKYPNRRYYDATRSEHLTLEDIRARIREGYDIRVTNSKTGADITAKVLAQIILELDEGKIEAFPVALLQRLIRVNDHLIKEFVDRYFNQALQHYIQYRQQVEKQLRNTSEMNPFFTGAAAWARGMFDPFGASPPAGPAQTASSPGTDSKTYPGGADLREQVMKLQEQIANLQANLPAKPKRKAARSKG